ncbi:TipAS antibiotic-recognition domain-containing protein [Paenibacillus antarcticus]|uniref:TipAS antibiotic-recognition domain-containing protein n=1 Tax=Paenibacillus antarcticus TaxID=253703 RepID=A0A168NH69_9BACL|nr:TipAS antibiotic-recognition domain-containing protein [Paenibacillus antarcticus]OAB45793.1 hypothetical protein PBAT_12890 [Paenibacillus antarcticus]
MKSELYDHEPLEQDILQRYGDSSEDIMEESKKKMEQWTRKDEIESQAQVDRVNIQLKGAIEAGLAPSSPEVQQIIHRHFKSIGRLYKPTAEVYRSLGELYVSHLDFKNIFDSYHPNLAEYLRDGMKIFAKEQL